MEVCRLLIKFNGKWKDNKYFRDKSRRFVMPKYDLVCSVANVNINNLDIILSRMSSGHRPHDYRYCI